MNKWKNLIYLLVFTLTLFFLKFFVIDPVFAGIDNDSEIWFSSGLLLVVFGLFVTEKFFTKPLDVIVNIINVIVVLLTLDNSDIFLLYNELLLFVIVVGLIAFLSFILIDEEKDNNDISQRIALSANRIASFLGSSKMLFSIVFILSIFSYFIFSLESNSLITAEQISVLSLIFFWGAVLLVEPIDKVLITPTIKYLFKKDEAALIGRIYKRTNPRVIYIEKICDTDDLRYGDIVFFGEAKIKKAIRIEDLTYAMFINEVITDDKVYLKMLNLGPSSADIEEKFVHKANFDLPETVLSNKIYSKKGDIIGFVYDNSNIDVLKIEMIHGKDNTKALKEGDLISVDLYHESVKYQIINVETNSEVVEGKNKDGNKIITAQQIGSWNNHNKRFIDASWVPDLNSPVFIEDSTKEINLHNPAYFKVGVVPRSSYPVYIDLDESVNHHIAIIGKTGTGKSRMAAKMIERMSSNGYKVVVLDVDRGNNAQSLVRYISNDLVETQKSNDFNLHDSSKNIISIDFDLSANQREGGPFNLSDMATEIIEKVISYQKESEDAKVCIVLEEAYDFIPESNFGNQKYGQPNVSRISQMVLKCRKHNIGFLIITQRTALVTKTILYQCHTIFALQSFDETSKGFMSSYINQKYLDSMSILPRFRAIVVGKGSNCDKPVIVDFMDKSLIVKKDDESL